MVCFKVFFIEYGYHESYLLSVRLTLDFAAREKAIVINLEFIRAIVTADEILLLEPLAQEVIPFIDKLRHHFPLKNNALIGIVGEGVDDLQDAIVHEPG